MLKNFVQYEGQCSTTHVNITGYEVNIFYMPAKVGDKHPKMLGNKFAVGNNGGRPTKYTPAILKRAKQYLPQCNDQIITDEYGKVVRVIVRLPKLAGLALWLNVSPQTLTRWGDKYKEFWEVINDVNTAQEDRLVDSGLSGNYNPTIAKLIISAKHNYREKSDVTTDDKPISQEVHIRIERALDEV